MFVFNRRPHDAQSRQTYNPLALVKIDEHSPLTAHFFNQAAVAGQVAFNTEIQLQLVHNLQGAGAYKDEFMGDGGNGQNSQVRGVA